jgi:hypothetical protein
MDNSGRLDREKTIQEIITALATLEKCSGRDIENVKRFLRWMSDDALRDMKEKHRKALQNIVINAQGKH